MAKAKKKIRNQPLRSSPPTSSDKPMTDNTVKFGDNFYLKHSTGQYLIAVDRGKYNWPQLGNTGKVTLQLVGQGEVVKSQNRIKIRSMESVTGSNDILGAFSNSRDCYYWQNGYDEDKQSWLITKVSGEGGPIHYEDGVYLTNCSYGTQLCADTSNLGYITTAEDSKNWWILESTVPLSSAQESSSPPTASSVTPSQPATAPPNVAPSPSATTEQSDTPVIPAVMSSSYQQSCTEISINGDVLSATCKRRDGSLNKTSIVLKGIENIDGQLKIIDPSKPSNYQQSCTEISINGDVLSATCQRGDGSLNKTSIVLEGIENIDGNLTCTGTSVAPSPPAATAASDAPSIPAAGSVGEQPGQPATAPPNVAPSPPAPTAASNAPSIPVAVSGVGQPSQPAVTQSRQKVLVFGANHQGIAVGGGALRPQGRFTIEAWVYSATDARRQVILAEGEALFYLEGGELKFQIAPTAEAITSVGAGLTAGNWYHVAVVRAGSRPGDTRLYINGIQNDNQIAISPVLTFGNTYLGGQPNKPEYRFQGKLLEVRVWRFARSQEEIEANRLYPLTGRELGLVRCWSLNETVGTTLDNKTTSPSVGTVSGEAVWEEVEIPLKLKLDPQERLLQSTGLEDYAYWYRVIAKQQEPVADPSFRRGRIWT